MEAFIHLSSKESVLFDIGLRDERKPYFSYNLASTNSIAFNILNDRYVMHRFPKYKWLDFLYLLLFERVRII